MSLTKIKNAQPLSPQAKKIVDGANRQIGKTIYYNPKYLKLEYPLGDPPIASGVCTDVVVRALRAMSLDLQKSIHEDMAKNFEKYPQIWGLKRTDKNIDHRRVPNQQKFFNRKGWSIDISKTASDYKPGDIVSWKLGNGRDHIGVITNYSTLSGRPLIVHNIGIGAVMEDVLFDWKITGHFRIK